MIMAVEGPKKPDMRVGVNRAVKIEVMKADIRFG
jgi:hypothetical protein